MSYENTNLFLTDTETAPQAIEQVVVSVFSEDGTTFISSNQTDTAGVAAFLLPPGIYQCRFFKFGVSFTQPLYIEVVTTPDVNGKTNDFNVQGEVYKYPQATDPHLCQVSGFFRTPSGALARYVDMHFIATFDPILLGGATVVTERVVTRSNRDGYVSFTLIRNGKYDVTLEGTEDILRTVTVPDQAWVNVGDLIFPKVSNILYEPTPANPLPLTVGNSVTLNVKVGTTSRLYLEEIASDVDFSMEDPTVAAFELQSGKIKFTGLAPGSTNFLAKRKDNTIISIPDADIINGVLPITVA